MKKLLQQYFPNAAIIFTVCTLLTASLNLFLWHDSYGINMEYLIQSFLFFLAAQYVFDWIDCLPLKNPFAATVVNFFVIYGFFLFVSTVFHWFPFTVSYFILETAIFIIIYAVLQLYLTMLYRKKVDEINALLEKRMMN